MISKYLRSLSISDLILILLCLFVAVVLFGDSEDSPSSLYIYKDDHLWGQFPLAEDRILEIDEHNSVQIKDGKARMLFSDCPDKRCVKQGFNSNMPIICLPNHLILEFTHGSDEHRLILQ